MDLSIGAVPTAPMAGMSNRQVRNTWRPRRGDRTPGRQVIIIKQLMKR
jgi:hypothetical protein